MSIQIKKLEKEIGATLFERDARKMRLTPAGQLVQKTFASILGSYNAMLWQARSIEQEQKCLRIGYHGPSDWAGILSLFRRCLSQNPSTRIQIESAEYGELAKKLEQGKPDLAFLEAADAKGRDALKWTPLFDDYGCFAMAKEHPLAALKQIAPADLRDQTIYFNLRPSASMQTIFQKLVQSGIPPEKLACVEGTETAIAQALAYGGLAAVPMTFQNDKNPQIAYVPNASPLVHMDFCLAWRAENETGFLLRFVEHSKAHPWPRTAP